jgi:SAM-dependent methyltransferase
METPNSDISPILERIRHNWEMMAKDNAMWAILTNKDKWEVNNFFATGQDFTNNIMNYFQSLKIAINYGDCLDFGCGIGRLTQPLAKLFERVVGVDVSSEMILHADKFNMYTQKVRYMQNTENLPFPDQSFDYVQTHIVLQHIDYTLTMHYLEEFVRVLRTGGILYFQLPVSLGGSEGVCHFENKIHTKYGTVSMDMNCIPQEIILDKLTALGVNCLHSKVDYCPDGMKSCLYVACR